jgi:hypothetical protein
MKTTYHYIVDLDERGIYKAHVENAETGKIVFEISNEDEDGNTSVLWIVEDGFMEHTKDMAGLGFYLFDMGIINQNDPIVYKG